MPPVRARMLAKARRTPTVHDVAAEAGVSIATVSRVLNGSGRVSDGTAARVNAAVAKTRFRANAIGRMLKTSATRTVGVLVPSLRNPVFADAVAGIERACAEHAHAVLLTCADYRPELELKAVETLLGHRVAGLVLTVSSGADSPSLALLRQEGVPFVLMFNPGRRGLDPVVSIDNAAAAEAAVHGLIARGHRRIAMLAGRYSASDRSLERRRGYERAMKRAGLAPGPVLEVDFDAADLAGTLAPPFAGAAPPTALFCSTDLIALGAMRGLRELGLLVPRDVAVVGFDGISLGECVAPTLATVVQPAVAIGHTACRELIRMSTDGRPPGRTYLPFTLRDGESWGSRIAERAA